MRKTTSFPGSTRNPKEFPFRAHVEAHVFFKMLENPEGLSVLDLACGEGYYSRMIRRRGAAKVVGADLSGEMIALAREQEAQEPLGIEYIHAGAENLGVFDSLEVWIRWPRPNIGDRPKVVHRA